MDAISLAIYAIHYRMPWDVQWKLTPKLLDSSSYVITLAGEPILPCLVFIQHVITHNLMIVGDSAISKIVTALWGHDVLVKHSFLT